MPCSIAIVRGARTCGEHDCDECYGPHTLWMECLCGWSGSASECRGHAIDGEPGVIESACPRCRKAVYPKR